MESNKVTSFWDTTRKVLPTGLTLLLVCGLVGTALAVVYNAQQSRQLFSQLESLRQAQNELDSQWGRLTLERGTLLSHAHVEQVAKQRLTMHRPQPHHIVVVHQ